MGATWELRHLLGQSLTASTTEAVRAGNADTGHAKVFLTGRLAANRGSRVQALMNRYCWALPNAVPIGIGDIEV